MANDSSGIDQQAFLADAAAHEFEQARQARVDAIVLAIAEKDGWVGKNKEGRMNRLQAYVTAIRSAKSTEEKNRARNAFQGSLKEKVFTSKVIAERFLEELKKIDAVLEDQSTAPAESLSVEPPSAESSALGTPPVASETTPEAHQAPTKETLIKDFNQHVAEFARTGGDQLFRKETYQREFVRTWLRAKRSDLEPNDYGYFKRRIANPEAFVAFCRTVNEIDKARTQIDLDDKTILRPLAISYSGHTLKREEKLLNDILADLRKQKRDLVDTNTFAKKDVREAMGKVDALLDQILAGGTFTHDEIIAVIPREKSASGLAFKLASLRKEEQRLPQEFADLATAREEARLAPKRARDAEKLLKKQQVAEARSVAVGLANTEPPAEPVQPDEPPHASEPADSFEPVPTADAESTPAEPVAIEPAPASTVAPAPDQTEAPAVESISEQPQQPRDLFLAKFVDDADGSLWKKSVTDPSVRRDQLSQAIDHYISTGQMIFPEGMIKKKQNDFRREVTTAEFVVAARKALEPVEETPVSVLEENPEQQASEHYQSLIDDQWNPLVDRYEAAISDEQRAEVEKEFGGVAIQIDMLYRAWPKLENGKDDKFVAQMKQIATEARVHQAREQLHSLNTEFRTAENARIGLRKKGDPQALADAKQRSALLSEQIVALVERFPILQDDHEVDFDFIKGHVKKADDSVSSVPVVDGSRPAVEKPLLSKVEVPLVISGPVITSEPQKTRWQTAAAWLRNLFSSNSPSATPVMAEWIDGDQAKTTTPEATPLDEATQAMVDRFGALKESYLQALDSFNKAKGDDNEDRRNQARLVLARQARQMSDLLKRSPALSGLLDPEDEEWVADQVRRTAHIKIKPKSPEGETEKLMAESFKDPQTEAGRSVEVAGEAINANTGEVPEGLHDSALESRKYFSAEVAQEADELSEESKGFLGKLLEDGSDRFRVWSHEKVSRRADETVAKLEKKQRVQEKNKEEALAGAQRVREAMAGLEASFLSLNTKLGDSEQAVQLSEDDRKKFTEQIEEFEKRAENFQGAWNDLEGKRGNALQVRDDYKADAKEARERIAGRYAEKEQVSMKALVGLQEERTKLLELKKKTSEHLSMIQGQLSHFRGQLKMMKEIKIKGTGTLEETISRLSEVEKDLTVNSKKQEKEQKALDQNIARVTTEKEGWGKKSKDWTPPKEKASAVADVATESSGIEVTADGWQKKVGDDSFVYDNKTRKLTRTDKGGTDQGGMEVELPMDTMPIAEIRALGVSSKNAEALGFSPAKVQELDDEEESDASARERGEDLAWEMVEKWNRKVGKDSPQYITARVWKDVSSKIDSDLSNPIDSRDFMQTIFAKKVGGGDKKRVKKSLMKEFLDYVLS